jgi:hypothetical protein
LLCEEQFCHREHSVHGETNSGQLRGLYDLCG